MKSGQKRRRRSSRPQGDQDKVRQNPYKYPGRATADESERRSIEAMSLRLRALASLLSRRISARGAQAQAQRSVAAPVGTRPAAPRSLRPRESPLPPRSHVEYFSSLACSCSGSHFRPSPRRGISAGERARHALPHLSEAHACRELGVAEHIPCMCDSTFSLLFPFLLKL